MLEVKKTKSGKLCFELSHFQRDRVFDALLNFLESESVNILGLKIDSANAIARSLYYNVLNEFTNRTDFGLHNNAAAKWRITRSEAVSLMWLLRGYDHIMCLMEIKTGLHKQLQS